MNQFFDWQRLTRYSKAHFKEEKRHYFWFFVIISLIYFLILMMLAINPRYRTEDQIFMYYAGLFITGSVFSARYFSALSNNGSALMSLMQPVSTFEKWLLALLTISIAYPLVYTLIFEVMTLPLVWLSQHSEVLRASEARTPYEPDLERYQLYIPFFTLPKSADSGHWLPLYGYSIYLGLISYALTTSIYFKKTPFIKSIALGFALFLVFLLVFGLSLSVGSNQASIGLFYWTLASQGYQGNTVALISASLLWIIAPVFMIVASFFALKERDL